LHDALLLYVSEQPGETILSLKCEDDSPAFDQRVWLVRVVKDLGWAWQVHHLHHERSGEPASCPKFAWKDVAPPAPARLSRQTLDTFRKGHYTHGVRKGGQSRKQTSTVFYTLDTNRPYRVVGLAGTRLGGRLVARGSTAG